MKKIYLFFLFLIYVGHVLAQQKVADMSLANLLNLQDSLHTRLPVEKVYLQLDKPYYTLGDTLRFKSYLLDADLLTPSIRSGLLYVELDDESAKMVRQIMVPVVAGLSWGDMPLTAGNIPEGSYTIRAYTNWMRNFGEDYIFKKNIYLSRANNTSTLIKADFKLANTEGKNKVEASLRFNTLNKRPIVLQDMQLRVLNGTHSLLKAKSTTGFDGTMNLSFELADKTVLKNLSLQGMQTGKGADTTKINIPITINRPENTDLQFMPEGGNLVGGIPAKIGFKAIGEDGKGTDVSGSIYNSKQEVITTFKSAHKGMGSFELPPVAGESYTAKLDLPNGTMKSYVLPPINASGTTLRINQACEDSLEVVLNLQPNPVTAPAHGTYYVVGQSRGTVCYAASFVFKNAATRIKVAKIFFPTGIARFTLLNNQYQPLNERIVYVDHHDELNIRITPNKQNYAVRDSIALNIVVTDKAGKPVQGDFSLAVTDDSQVRTDSLGSSIENNLLLSSDLKGDIEDPAYYLKPNPQNIEALDNLLLTQGWVGYDWKQITAAKIQPPQYLPEAEFTITGKALNAFDKGVENVKVNLMSPSPFYTADAITDKQGNFTFKGDLAPSDSTAYILQAKRKNGGSNITIDINKSAPPQFAPQVRRIAPWYVNSDTLMLKSIDDHITEKLASDKMQFSGKLLKDVVIQDKRIITDSFNLNGSGADFVFDEETIQKAGKQSLRDFLLKHFKGFHARPYRGREIYSYDDRWVCVIANGARVSSYFYLNAVMTEQVKGIEIMSTYAYTNQYMARFFTLGSGANPDPVFIEVTTFGGNGAFINKTPNMAVYMPLPFTLPKQFYRPRYTVNNKTANAGNDLRSTIHWEPNIITDKNGKATISFYASDRPNSYTVIMEGSDMKGNIGSVVQKLGAGKNSP